MLTKSIIVSAAILAGFVALEAGNAQARTSSDFNVGVPNPSYGAGYGAHYEPSVTFAAGTAYQRVIAISCGQARSVVQGNGFYNVSAIDCSAPNYKFVAWQAGSAYRVRVNGAGMITGVARL